MPKRKKKSETILTADILNEDQSTQKFIGGMTSISVMSH